MADKDTSNDLNADIVANNGLLDRRLLLKSGVTFAMAGLSSDLVWAEKIDLANPPWMKEPGAPPSNYGNPSPHEDEVVRYPAANSQVNGNGSSWTPLHAMEGGAPGWVCMQVKMVSI